MSAPPGSRGFTLIEVIVAMAIVVAVSIGVVQLFATAASAGRTSRDRTVAVALAAGKLEQLRSLDWRFDLDAAGGLVPRTDTQSNLSVEPAAAGGGGLSESPPGTLDSNIPPYVDYLDRLGRWTASGRAPQSDAIYIRRWAIRRVPADPQQLIALQVLVTTVQRARSRTPGTPYAWNGEDVLLSTVVTRKVRR